MFWGGAIRLADIVRANWKRYLAWRRGKSTEEGGGVRPAVVSHVQRMLACRTPALGMELYACPECENVRVVPHSCKSVACSSCGKARTDDWCKQLLSDIVDVPYRHLVFTLPWQLRLPIYDNREVLLNVLFRAAADAILSLTAGTPTPLGRRSQQWLAGVQKTRRKRRGRGRKRRPFVPGFITVLHTYGSDLKWNPHLHVVITSGGLSLDEERWIAGPKRYLVPAPLLGTEWKLRVIKGIRDAHQRQPLRRRRLRSDRRRRIDIGKLLGHVRKRRWRILIGPSLKSAEKAVRYAIRYSKRPVIAEGRVLNYNDGGGNGNGYVTYRFKDYHQGGAMEVKSTSVLWFLFRVFQHFPEAGFRQVRHYGMFSTRRRGTALRKARQLLAQRKKRRPRPTKWEQRRKAAGNRRPLSCPRCRIPMTLWLRVFGSPQVLARLVNLEPHERIPPDTTVSRSKVLKMPRLRRIAA